MIFGKKMKNLFMTYFKISIKYLLKFVRYKLFNYIVELDITLQKQI